MRVYLTYLTSSNFGLGFENVSGSVTANASLPVLVAITNDEAREVKRNNAEEKNAVD